MQAALGPAPYTHACTRARICTHTHSLTRAMCNAEFWRPGTFPQQTDAWELAKNVRGGGGWRGGGSLAPKKLSDGRELYSAPPLTTPGFPLQVLLPSLRCTWAVGCTPLQARAYFCAHPQAAIGEPTAIRSPHMSSASAHTCTAPGAQPRLSANTSTVVHASTGTRPSGRALLKPGEVRANSHRPRRYSAEAPRARSRSAPWCSSRALLPVLPLPLSLSLFPQIFSPALPPVESSFSLAHRA